jgi:hypothetical protein
MVNGRKVLPSTCNLSGGSEWYGGSSAKSEANHSAAMCGASIRNSTSAL